MNTPVYSLFINNVQTGWYDTTEARRFALDDYLGSRDMKRILYRGKALYVWLDDEDEDYDEDEVVY